MQKSQTQKYAIVPIPTGLWKEVTRAVKTSGIYNSADEFIREAIRQKLQQLAPKQKKMPKQELEHLVLQYLQQHEKAYATDISNDLKVPYLTAAKTLNRLVEKGLLESSYY